MSYTGSQIKAVQAVVNSCYQQGIRHVVLSPGSRNAPFIATFGNHPHIRCYTIVDERSAAFYALGMTLELQAPVALVCTSGSAVLNYAPAVVEAYYQEVPLIVITADRPEELIDQEDGQTIQQQDIYRNYSKESLHLAADLAPGAREALNKIMQQAQSYPQGPVHINVALREPLYQLETLEVPALSATQAEAQSPFQLSKELQAQWQQAKKVLLVCGLARPNKKVSSLLQRLAASGVVVLAPALSNHDGFDTTPDPLCFSPAPEVLAAYKPDLLLTIGGPVLSKFLKMFLRTHQPEQHWDIDLNPKEVNTYGCLTQKLIATSETVLQALCDTRPQVELNYAALWQQRQETVATHHQNFLKSAAWSDIKVLDIFFQSIHSPIQLHLANSTPVRYAEFFPKHPFITYHANRGTSGIDGCSSTAAGAALHSELPVYLITGDLSFLYDSNALWNQHVPDNLKIIVINNQGGNIFKVIKGPDTTGQLPVFEAHAPVQLEKLCQAYGHGYLLAHKEDELQQQLKALQQSSTCTILEVRTDSDVSAGAYRDYFKAIL